MNIDHISIFRTIKCVLWAICILIIQTTSSYVYANSSSPPDGARTLVKTYLTHRTQISLPTFRTLQEGTWELHGETYSVIASRIESEVDNVSRPFVCIVLGEIDVIACFEVLCEEDACFELSDSMLRIKNSLPINISSYSNFYQLSGMAYGDLIAQLDPADYAWKAAEAIGEQIRMNGLAAIVGQHDKELLARLANQSAFQALSSREVLNEIQFDQISQLVPLESIKVSIRPITFNDVIVPRFRLSKYWECVVHVTLSGTRDNQEAVLELEIGVTGCVMDRDRVDAVWINQIAIKK